MFMLKIIVNYGFFLLTISLVLFNFGCKENPALVPTKDGNEYIKINSYSQTVHYPNQFSIVSEANIKNTKCDIWYKIYYNGNTYCEAKRMQISSNIDTQYIEPVNIWMDPLTWNCHGSGIYYINLYITNVGDVLENYRTKSNEYYINLNEIGSGGGTRNAKIEYDYEGLTSNWDRWNLDSCNKTFLKTGINIVKSSMVDILDTSTIILSSRFNVIEELGDSCIKRMRKFRSDTVNYPYYLNVSYYYKHSDSTLNISNIGISSYNNLLSFVFYKKLLNFYPELNSENQKKALINSTIDHELIHQIGKMDHHNLHNGDTAKCIFNTTNLGIQTDLTNGRMAYYICPRDCTVLKNINLENSLNFSQNKLSAGIKNIFNSNDSISIKLNKKIYKKYEPINYIFTYINNGNESDTIFEPIFGGELTYYLLDNNNKSYGERFGDFIPEYAKRKPEYIIKPKDSLELIFCLNNYIGKELNEEYFYNKSYFDPGKYSISVKIQINNEYFLSDVLHYEVEDISKVEKKIIEFSNDRKYDYLIEKFSNNYFMEYILFDKLSYLFSLKASNTNIDIDKIDNELLNTTLTLLRNFPQSNYFIGFPGKSTLSFLSNYYSNFDKLYSFLEENYKDSKLFKSLNVDYIKLAILNKYMGEKDNYK